MKRKKSMLMAALMMTAVSLMACTNAPQGETIVIEGRLANVPDSLVIELYEYDGNAGNRIARDTVMDGKFRFEVETEIEGVHSASIDNFDIGLQTYSFLWIKPGANIRITGDGLDYSAWQIESNVAAQKTENRFREAVQAERSQLHRIDMEHAPLMQRYEGGRDGKQHPSDEERKQMQARLRELRSQQSSINMQLIDKEEALLDTETPDEAWMERLYRISLKFKITKDTVAGARGIQLYDRMDERLKASYRGQSIANNLFPPQVVTVGRMLPENIELKDTLGNVHHLQELRGKYVLLDFWFSGCDPCIESFPEMREISEQMADSLEVISISQDSEKEWRRASARHGITWHNWNDLQRENGIFARFRIRTIPHYFLISPEGKIIATDIGYSKGSLLEFVKKTIAEHNKQK